jgi:uncharacterized protein
MTKHQQFSTRHAKGPMQPWWRIRMMWLALGGPALVAVASIASAVLAIRSGDVPLQLTGADQPSLKTSAHRPAVQARNHAATPTR